MFWKPHMHILAISNPLYTNMSGIAALYSQGTDLNMNKMSSHADVIKWKHFFRVTDHLCGEFTGPGELPAQRPVTRSFYVFFDLRPNNGWINNHEAGDLRWHRGHYDGNVMPWSWWTDVPLGLSRPHLTNSSYGRDGLILRENEGYKETQLHQPPYMYHA